MTPTELMGLGFILLALLLLVVEVKTAGFGLSGVSGALALFLGLVLLFGLSWATLPFLLLSSLLLVGLFAFLGYLAYQARQNKVVTGEAGMIGLEGRAETALLPEGKVCVRGEIWDAWSPVRLEPGMRVRVIGVRGLKLEVTAADPTQALRASPLSALLNESEHDG